MNTFCTIVTQSHLPYALALNQSINKFDVYATMQVLVVDSESTNLSIPENVRLLTPEMLTGTHYAVEIWNKYFTKKKDHYRWSMKPVLINHLISEGFNKVIYLDCDIHFFAGHDFLFQLLNEYRVLLTPHWESFSPYKNQNGFVRNIKNGFFNAGFIAVNRGATNILDWWARLCLYKCEEDSWNGFYVDQGYLSLLPVYFEGVKIMHHTGCNVADWNIEENKRTVRDGQVLVGGFPIIFIHFAHDTIKDILDGEDSLLKGYLNAYEISLHSFDPTIDLKKKLT